MSSAPQRALPSIEKLLQALGPTPLPRPVVVSLAREQVAAWRNAGETPSFEAGLGLLQARLAVLARSRLQPVINATGILAHTNLGRAPLGPAAVDSLTQVARGYSNLELDLESGERGGRGAWLEHCLALACGAEAATVVNNCAAALILVLRHFAGSTRREAVVSRGELVQIGGGFRVPEILETSGARLREVGTTNRTSVDDYRRALGPDTALILKVHRSNFFMEGFVASPTTAELAGLAREHRVPLVEDLGSGALVDIASLAPVAHEIQPQEVLRSGADVVCFSGDKLLGGPQAGIIAGRKEPIAALKRDPFFRALRCDKLVFAALQATVESHLHAAARKDHGPPADVPLLALLRLTPDELRLRAERFVAALKDLPVKAEIGDAKAQIGGGVCPRSSIPSVAVRLRLREGRLEDLAARLRHGSPPVIGFLADDCLQLDLRTVFPDQDEALTRAIRAAVGEE